MENDIIVIVMRGGGKFVTIRQAAKMLNMKVRTIRDWIHKGKINAIKDEKNYRWLIFVDDIRDLTEGKHADQN